MRLLDELSRLGGQQLMLRALVLLAPLLAATAEQRAGATVSVWYLASLVLASLVAALLPDSHAGLLVVLLVGGHWLTSSGQSLSLWVLCIALALALFHVAGLLASYGPPSVVLEPELLRFWLRRYAVCAAVTALVWLVARVSTGLSLSGSALVFGAGLLVVAGWSVLLSRLVAGPTR